MKDESKKDSSMEQFNKSIKDFESRQGKASKEINMKSKSTDGFLKSLGEKFRSVEYGNVIGHSLLEKNVIWISSKRVFVGVGLVMMIAIAGFCWGITNNEQAEKNLEATKKNLSESKSAVQGNHLINIPKDYSDLAESKSFKDKGQTKKDVGESLKDDYYVVAESEKSTSTSNPVIVYDTYADRAHQYEEDLKLKALESPIAFEIKEDK